MLAVLVAIDALGDEVRLLRAVLAGRDALERLRLAGREHPAVVFDELPRGLFGVELEIVPADDIGRRAAEEAGGRLVDEHVAPFEILDEDRVRRGLDHRLQDVGAVRNRHRSVLSSYTPFSQIDPGGRRTFRESVEAEGPAFFVIAPGD